VILGPCYASFYSLWCGYIHLKLIFAQQRKSTFERKLSTENEDRDQTGSGLEAKAPRWFTDNIQSGRAVKRSMSEESDDVGTFT
jgi:hypothetical protein